MINLYSQGVKSQAVQKLKAKAEILAVGSQGFGQNGLGVRCDYPWRFLILPV